MDVRTLNQLHNRFVKPALGIVEAGGTLNGRLRAEYGVALAVRLGLHTGPVVAGAMGGGGRHEHLALGETPNIAARLEGLAAPNTVVISAVTTQLVQRAFVLEALGPQALKGITAPMAVWRVVGPLETLHEATTPVAEDVITPLVGRGEEVGLMVRRWEQSKAGQGQVVFISGEAGIGKSALVDTLRARAARKVDTCRHAVLTLSYQQCPLSGDCACAASHTPGTRRHGRREADETGAGTADV
jgi:hypothetical protein